LTSDDRLSGSPAVGFIGLGAMGLPMARRLLAAGYAVRGADLSTAARDAFAADGGSVHPDAADCARGAEIVITMLPDSGAVRTALLGEDGAASALAAGALVVDMSSSAPTETRRLAEDLRALDIDLVDAPVSGGVRRAADGTLAIMVGGELAAIDRARPLLEHLGDRIIVTGPTGSGHAVKALNNYVSAAGLTAACEAVLVARSFGIEPDVLVDALNASTGRNNSTEVKLKPFVLSGTFASGFAMNLMAKDLRTAAELAAGIGVRADGIAQAAAAWTDASEQLGRSADHTEIYRYLAERAH
jgi:3-hydroxyisobutyrate dehydrogenase